MRYIDSGGRDPETALGHWLESVLVGDVGELRWQAGYFALEGIGLMVPTLKRLQQSDGPVRAILGSNRGDTLADDVSELVRAIGVPRANAQLGVVSFARGLFHGKTYHVTRLDGTACAYVGSANLTYTAVSGLNIEAGVTVDSRDGDPPDLLEAIANGIDAWFAGGRSGFYAVNGEADVMSLGQSDVLATSRLARPKSPEADDADSDGDDDPGGSRARLSPLVTLPRVRSRAPRSAIGATAAGSPATATGAAVPRRGFPEYFLFDPDADSATIGAAALSGASLPSGAQGLIIRLNRDSGRHFDGRGGTANISIPIATVGTLRFGIHFGASKRPRAEFVLRSRFVSESANILGSDLDTNVMAYGYADGGRGHKDVRMMLPLGISEIGDQIRNAGFTGPTVGDLALLEWPTLDAPVISLTFVDKASTLYQAISRAFDAAEAGKRMVGGKTCWLPEDLSPRW